MEEKFICIQCQKEHLVNHSGGIGYGINEQGDKICYDCCGKNDAEEMKSASKYTLYLCKDKNDRWILTNWPGTFIIKLSHVPWKGRHNIAKTRYDVHFRYYGNWHGVNYGENSQVCHCRRMKGD